MLFLEYPKYQGRKLKILHFHEPGYFLEKELSELVSNEFELKQFLLKPGPQLVTYLLQFIADFRPDFVLSINYRGFDPQGELFKIFSQIRLDVVVWFLDNPFYLLSQTPQEMSSPKKVFLWDSSYVDEYKSRFNVNAEFLPLATSDSFVRQGSFDINGPRLFVGSSMMSSINEIESHIPKVLLSFLPPLKQLIIKDKGFKANIALKALLKEMLLEESLLPKLEEYIRYSLTSEHRQELILKSEVEKVFGDSDWKKLVHPLICQKSLEYYSQLPSLFKKPGIHFNLTHFQMPHGVNQRVFDVVNCGGVLITDRQADLVKLFPEWKDWSYETIDSISDLINRIDEQQDEYKEVFLGIQNKVRANHTYRVRLEQIVDSIRTEG